jgi:hypothetical protein
MKYMILTFASQQHYQEMVGQPSAQPATMPQRSGHTEPRPGQRPISSNSATLTSRSAAWPQAPEEPGSDRSQGVAIWCRFSPDLRR